jgi:hypothetical protein
MAYHKAVIKRGVLGEISKIQEELDELVDAEAQNVTILALCELSDLVGAIDAYLKARHPSITLKDLIDMHMLTKSAFQDGTR